MKDTITIFLGIFFLLLIAALVVALIRWKGLKSNLLREKEKQAGILAELKSLRQNVAHRKTEQTEIIHRIVHDLRTPLNNIIGFTDILLSGMEGDLTESQRKDVEIILNSARSLTDQINDLLEMDAIESGTLLLNRTLLSPSLAIREAVEELRKEIDEKGCTVTIEVPDDLPPLHVDAQRLQQILARLLAETLHYLQKGEILFRAESSDRNGNPPSSSSPGEKDFLRISMTVHHTGMEEKYRESFFRMCLPAEATERNAPGGSSIGIRNAQSLIHLQGGKIGLESKGNRVRGLWLTLPTVKNPQ